MREQIKQEISEALGKQIKKREELESTVCILQEGICKKLLETSE